MAAYKAPVTDMEFLLQAIVEADSLWPALGLTETDSETATAILEEAAKLMETVLAPLNRDADETGCQLRDGEVITPAGFQAAYAAYADGGWGALGGDPAYGGMGLPKTLVACVEEMLQGANMALGLAPMLTAGACLALAAHGSEALKAHYLPKLYSGQWSGAMDLTEPHAGTDLGLIRTRAEAQSDGSYRLTGTKIFITWGDHDMAENIVHLVLARLPDAPSGVKGISLFLVPKWLSTAAGDLTERNRMSVGSLEKKMGIKASATCVMNFDGATGWLVGEVNKGLAAMFTMMNYERLTVGIQAVAVAEASYQTAADYARNRLQSQHPAMGPGPAPLLAHGDIRRQLLCMRALNEGSRAFYLYVATFLDTAKFSTDAAKRLAAENRIALLTPVAKAFISDKALTAALAGQQILGGHGYIREWGQEQAVRDIRITQIYEGTNGIQALDLLGRKVVANQGLWLGAYLDEIEQFARGAETSLTAWAQQLIEATSAWRSLSAELIREADTNAINVKCVAYLHGLGIISYAYLWLRQAQVATQTIVATQTRTATQPRWTHSFCEGKRQLCHYYFEQEFPALRSLQSRLLAPSQTVMAPPSDWF